METMDKEVYEIKKDGIMMLTKEADGRLTYCYDCKSEEDFNDLISMEVK